MRFRTIALALLAAGSTSSAFTPHKGADKPITTATSRQPRMHRSVGYTAPHGVQLGALADWHQIWDRDTDVPLRMWGPSIAYFASTANADSAEHAARDFLASHLALLAPGSSANDFVVVANQLDTNGHIRTVGFQQYASGVRVEGGTIGLVFERDHLVLVASTALPNVTVHLPPASTDVSKIDTAARTFLASDGIPVRIRSHGERVIVPMVYERGTRAQTQIAYHVADTVQVEAVRGSGRWDVWVDANNGDAVARKSLLHYLTGTVNFDVPDRYPLGTRHPQPAPQDHHTVNGAAVTSDINGLVTFTGASPATVAPGLDGTLVAMSDFQNPLVTDTLSLADGGTVTWSHAAQPQQDAQLATYVFVNQVKKFVRERVNPNLAWLNEQLSATVNENEDQCNAYSTGDDIHFYQETAGTCENTGRIADVVYHEFGHSLHANSIIQGVGDFDGSLSEGLADTTAVNLTGDHGMGRGFFFTNAALRDVDPPNVEKKWPQDADGEPHNEGEIIGEALYDLRKAMQTKYGEADGFNRYLPLYYGVMQRAHDIPSSYPALLVVDDDDGNLANGVPDQCAIDSSFALHGLTDPIGTLGLAPPTRNDYTVSFTAHAPTGGNPDCPPATITGANLIWSLRGGTTGPTITPLTASGDTYSVDIPHQQDGAVVLYHVEISLSDGTKVSYPDNPADPDYQMYVGPVTKIQCFDFEAGDQGWTHSGNPTNRDEWSIGAPMGLGGDPAAAFEGNNVLGQDLASDGLYRGNAMSWAISPDIDLMGNTQVHLQYYRWLNSEDAAYDQAQIFANGMSVWENFATPGTNPTSETNFTDKEWRFADVDLTAAVASGGPLSLKFELDADRGLSLAGWTVDNVCIVAVTASNPALCGNGAVDPGETCDDSNNAAGDGCSATCQTETIACADGSTDCDGGGCCSSSRDSRGAITLSLLTLGLVFRRRRRA